MAHDQHDEAMIRREWTGEAWLGLDSMRAPTRGQEGGWKLKDWSELRGTMGSGARRHAKGSGRRTYR